MNANSATVAWGEIQRLATTLQHQEPQLSESEAIAKAAESPEGQRWYQTLKRAQRRGERLASTPPHPVAPRADPPPWGEAYGVIRKAAAVLRERDPGLSEAEAVTRVVTEHPELYRRYREARREPSQS